MKSESYGVLYVVATPLGNLQDWSPRAIDTLKEVDLIACEDTRHARKLLTHFGISTATTSYHEHNEAARTPVLLKRLRQGQSLALVSDAGTPALSDPGYRLIRACREEGISVYPIPGPSAAVAALSASGLPSDRFLFLGFLPRRASQQKVALQNVAHLPCTLLIYLSPYALSATLKHILQVFGNRQACLFREMTKLHETHYFAPLEEITRRLTRKTPRGEYTLVVEGCGEEPAQQHPKIDTLAYVQGLIHTRGLSKKEAIKKAALELGLPKREVYQQATDPAAQPRDPLK